MNLIIISYLNLSQWKQVVGASILLTTDSGSKSTRPDKIVNEYVNS